MTAVSPPPAHRGDGPLRERGGVRTSVASDAASARAGSGRLTVLRGATGTGRSALLEAVVQDAEAHGMRVLRARCSTADSKTAFAAALRLLGRNGGSRSDATRARRAPEDRAVSRYHRELPAWLWRLLSCHADDAPLLLAVDDVHLADGPSRRWFAEAARRLDHLPVLIVATERSQYDMLPPAPGLAHSLSPTLVRVHALGPLSRAAAESLVRDGLGPNAPAAWVEGCVQAGAGNPLLLRALLEDLRSSAMDQAAGFPDNCASLYSGSFSAAVAWWLESAGPKTAAVARTLAELEEGHDDVELLAEVAGADPVRTSGWITAMLRLGLLRDDPALGRVGLAHPLLRDAVLEGWPWALRQSAHRRAAEARHRRGDPADAVAGHLLRAPVVGAAWAVHALLDAAAAALQAGRTADAAAILRRALDEPLSRARRAQLLTELGFLEIASARPAGIPRLAEAMRLRELPRERVEATVTLGSALARQGQAHAAFTLFQELKADRSLADDPLLTRTVRLAAALLSDHDRDIRREVYAVLRDAAAHRPAEIGPAERALLVRYQATAGLLSADQAMRQIRALLSSPEDPQLMPYLLGTAAAVAQWADALDDADRLVRSGLVEHCLAPLHPMHQALRNVRLDTAAARGEYARVLSELAGERAASGHPSNLLAQSLLALVETGRLAEAERLAQPVDLRRAQDSWELNRFLYARGVLRSAAGDPEGALADFLECGRRQTARDVLSPIVTPWRSAAAECLLALGSPQAALPLAEEEKRLAVVWDTPRLLGRALRVLGAASSGRRGQELTAQAVEVLRGAELDAELVSALVCRGRQLAAAGRGKQARPVLLEAAATAERLGAVRLQGLAEQALREGGLWSRATGLTGLAALTDSEARIARLAAAGRRNAEIADHLHLALRTVETHLTSTYRKLGIRGRSQLATALGGQAPTG